MLSLYAASFDPITKGHEWIIKNAPRDLIVVVANNANKQHRFSLQERSDLVYLSICKIARTRGAGAGEIEVGTLDNTVYLAEYAKSRNVRYLIRGVRGVADYEYERAYSDVNRSIDENLIHLLMVPPPELGAISSSVVRSLVGPKGWEAVVSKYVSEHVVDALRNKRLDTTAERLRCDGET
jgi:pantetheine-phosphate adenylyltransferase